MNLKSLKLFIIANSSLVLKNNKKFKAIKFRFSKNFIQNICKKSIIRVHYQSLPFYIKHL